MTVPLNLSDWTLRDIEDLLAKGRYESEQFDFKEMLPDSRNEAEKWRLRKTCCAFANSAGGFLIFGVKDDRALPIADRVVGIDAQMDFPEHFGAHPSKCTPSIEWDFLSPSLPLPNGNVVHVIHVPRSWQAPHWVDDLKNDGKHFVKRTNKGNEAMSYEEVKMAYLQYYEKRLKLQLLRAELETIQTTARTFIIPPLGQQTFGDVGELGVAVIETVLSDTYTILAAYPDLYADLTAIRQQCRVINSRTTRLYQTLGDSPRTSQRVELAVDAHNSRIRLSANQIEYSCHRAIQQLDEIIKGAGRAAN